MHIQYLCYIRLFIYTQIVKDEYAILEIEGVVYMCNNINNCNNNNRNCVSEILEVILLLQRNADCDETCLDSCDKGFLGCGPTCLQCNTRPVMLYSCCSGSTPLSFPISKNYDETVTSPIFRIEKLDGNCATFRVLVANNDETFTATNSFFTINLCCLSTLRCLNDIYVECI